MSTQTHALQGLKARYVRLLDCKQWEAWRELFVDDLVVEGMRVAAAGADEYVEKVSTMLASGVSVHQCSTPEFSWRSSSRARGVWAFRDLVEFEVDDEKRGFSGYGFYEEEYRRDQGRWQISTLRIARLRVDPIPGRMLPQFNLIAPSPDWLASDGFEGPEPKETS